MGRPEALFIMKMAALRTGLSPHVLRVWERRYRAVSPRRTAGNRRLYTEKDVERLILLREATLAGFAIGQIHSLPAERLRELVPSGAEAWSRGRAGRAHERRRGARPAPHLLACADAVRRLDMRGLEDALGRAALSLSRPVLLEKVLGPLLTMVGEGWHRGEIRIANEHAASAAVRSFLGSLIGPDTAPDRAPEIVVATPIGQVHELGALMVAATARSAGWRTAYFGASLPAEEIAAAASERRVRAVALGFTYPPDDPALAEELRRLRRMIPAGVPILIGGRAAPSYRDLVEPLGIEVFQDLRAFRLRLEALRAAAGPSGSRPWRGRTP